MPQMAPLLWLNLMVMFLIGYFLFYSMTYFIKIPIKPSSSKFSIKIMQKNWMW
uniref:ATP synthase F0 subunit 8 n=1 Tax=Neaxius acanthus TaxID=464341 RepID=L0E8Y7_9EUCA|nr:ATP synthase F0 subunit 8 [Neaxius acanthus]